VDRAEPSGHSRAGSAPWTLPARPIAGEWALGLTMLMAVQFPLADCRPFLNSATHRLQRPAWLHPRLDESYVRGFGGVRKRVRQSGWPGESVYCGGDRALRFVSDPKKLPDPVRDVATALSCAFRRLVSDGHAIGRFETGFTQSPDCGRLFPMGREEVPHVIKAVLQLPVTGPMYARLDESGPTVFACYSSQDLKTLLIDVTQILAPSKAKPRKNDNPRGTLPRYAPSLACSTLTKGLT
jgi:hypothetical protein